MRISVDFPPTDGRVIELLEFLIPPESREAVLRQLENPDKYMVSENDYEERLALAIDKIRAIATIAAALDNHNHNCQAIALRRDDLCDCPIGKLHRIIKAEPRF